MAHSLLVCLSPHPSPLPLGRGREISNIFGYDFYIFKISEMARKVNKVKTVFSAKKGGILGRSAINLIVA
jgi:hypothetical protein